MKDAVVSFVHSMDAVKSGKNVDHWDCSLGLPPIKLFPAYILHLVSSYWKDYTFSRYSLTIPYTRYYTYLLQQLNHIDPEIILQVHELETLGFELHQ